MKRIVKTSVFAATITMVYSVLFVFSVMAAAVIHAAWSVRLDEEVENQASEMKTLPEPIAGAMRFARIGQDYRIPILLYHYVEYVKDVRDTIRKSLDITPDVFESQVKTLKDNGYSFLTTSDVGDILDGKKEAPEKSVVLTFDDGYRDFYTDVFPILTSYSAKATVYLISGVIGQPNYMDATQIREIVSSGLVEFGAHTVHHISLAGKDSNTVDYEISASKRHLEKEYGISAVSFAYPYGAFDQQAVDSVRNAGYRIAVSTIEGMTVNQSLRFFLFRIRPGHAVGRELISHLDRIAKE